MRIRKHLSSVTIVVLLTAGLVCWPTGVAAAGQSDPDTEEFIGMERARVSQMEKAEAKHSSLILRLYGGFSQAEAGDLNEGLDGYFELLELYSAHGFGTTTGGYNRLRAGYNFGADLVLQVTRHIGIGLGAGYMRFSKSSLLTWSAESETIETSVAPTLSAVPIRAGVFLTLPLSKRLNLTADGGVAAYAALKLDWQQRLAFSGGDWVEWSVSASAPFDNIGFQGSLGLEYMVSQKVGLFVEALGRYARFKNFEKATAVGKDNYGASETMEGRIYLETYTYEGFSYSVFTVEETPPVSDDPHRVYTEPKIDLSGISLQAGFRIRF